jgi:hypothetical protein
MSRKHGGTLTRQDGDVGSVSAADRECHVHAPTAGFSAK